MAAGLTKKQWYTRMYNKLQSTKRELEKAGVAVVYRNLQLFPDMTGLTHETHDLGFNISFQTSRASNGEAAAWQVITVVIDGKKELYGWMQKDGDFEKGMLRVSQLFGKS